MSGNGWLPIETAPPEQWVAVIENGNLVMAFGSRHYDSGRPFENGEPTYWQSGSYADGQYSGFSDEIFPTHWHPLSPLPIT